MQIKIQLKSNCTSESSENVVQKVHTASNPRQNERHRHHEWMYIQVSSTSNCKVEPQCHQHWLALPLCSVDNFSILNLSILIRRLFLLDHDCWSLFYGRFLDDVLHFWNFYMILFYGYFNSQIFHHLLLWHQLQSHHSDAEQFCDFSTKSRNGLFSINDKDDKCKEYSNHNSIIYVKYGIESQRGESQTLATDKLRTSLRTLNFFYGILLIQRHLLICNNYEFSSNQTTCCERMRHQFLRQLLAHNQMMLYLTSICLHHYALTLSNENDNDTTKTIVDNGNVSITKSSSNHKLKDNTSRHQQSTASSRQKFSSFQQPQRAMHRSCDSMKSHLNAILVLIILCIPLLTTTAASSVHNLKYSTNVVKTKYGPLRGIVMRQNPTVEAYLGVPYGKIVNMIFFLFRVWMWNWHIEYARQRE